MKSIRMAAINLCLELKRIVEKELKRNDITYLLDYKEPKYIVYENEYIQEINYKVPAIIVDINTFGFEPLELGGSNKVKCTADIYITAISKADSLDIAEVITENIVGSHNFYDFSSTGNIPDLSVPYDNITLPTTILTRWEVEDYEDITISSFKEKARYETNYVELYCHTITFDFKYVK